MTAWTLCTHEKTMKSINLMKADTPYYTIKWKYNQDDTASSWQHNMAKPCRGEDVIL